jgi:uncharacterized delta-60 repeat protein
MNKLCKIVAVLTALCVASAALAVGAAAAKPTQASGARLDLKFGRGGGFTVATPKAEHSTIQAPVHLAVAPSNRAYVQQGSWVVAFNADGKPDQRFGNFGRMVVTPHTGQLAAVTGVAVDSENRVLVAGSLEPIPGLLPKAIKGEGETTVTQPHAVTEAFVIRYLPDGSLDTSFGDDGEVDTTLGAPRPLGTQRYPAEYERPSVQAVHIAVDAEDRPVIEGKFTQRIETCFYKAEVHQAIVARLNVDGSLDTSFGTNGYASIAGQTPISLAAGPDGSWAALAGPEVCEHGVNGLPAQLSVLTETGAALNTLDPGRPTLNAAEEVLAVDAQGRIYFTEREEIAEVPARVVRLLANGELDTSYGKGGAIGLKGLGATKVGGLAIDAKGRILAGFGSSQLEVVRISSAGKIDHSFAKHGAVSSKLGAATQLQALALDSKGRIVAAGLAGGTGVPGENGISIARFLP